ncbi:M24 family metallopeptidase [Patescibacteria group bacterium]|nr:M24 family metallopeptidase [Patescibacteria group bacterium]
MKKSPAEIGSIKKACLITDQTFKYILPHLIEGVSETDIVKKINKRIRKYSDGLAFKTIVAFGENSSHVHHKPSSDRKLKKGDIIMLDFGAKINGLCSDMTRTLFLGKPSKKQREFYEDVLKAQLLAIDYMKTTIINQNPVRSFDVDKIARDYLEDKKYPPMPHSLGHGIGKKVHSGLRLSPKSKSYLRSGMVFSIEPGIYIKDFGGVRIEDTVLLTKNNVEILTKSSKNLFEL